MPSIRPKVLDIVLIGTGISGLNFIDKYLEKKNFLHVVSPEETKRKISDKKYNLDLLPTQMRGKYTTVENFLDANKLTLFKDCKALGFLIQSGLSNY